MPRRNKRDTFVVELPLIKAEDEYRSLPECPRFPYKTLFTTGYRAQVAIDDLKTRSDRDKKPLRVYECLIDEGGCGYFHTTSLREYKDKHYEELPVF